MKNKNKYWLSLEQWGVDKDFQKLADSEKEFINPLPSTKESENLWERREFLQLMAASVALAGVSCVRRPTEKIVPYIKRPDDIALGEANFYSSSYYDGEEGFGILVKTREGRPIKIEGNKNHPINKGKLSARALSHILSLYDPERLQNPQQNLFNDTKSNSESIRATYPTADSDIVKHLKQKKTAFLTGEWPSPSSETLLKDFCKKTHSSHFVWNPLNHSALAQAQNLCYKTPMVPRFALDKARFIISIDCDFLGTWLSPTEFNRLYSKGRQANKDMNRLVVFESLLSLTGTNADWRVRIKPSQQLSLVLSLIHSLIQKKLARTKWPKHLTVSSAPWEDFNIDKLQWDNLILELWENREQSIILTGGMATKTDTEQSLHIAVQWLNNILGNDGKTIDYKHPYRTWTWADRNINTLIKNLETGKINTLIIHKTNPVYTYPNKARLVAAIKKAKLVIYTGDRKDETGSLAHYILPDHHELEKWSDWEFQKGTISIQQPTIRALYRTRSFEDALFAWAKELKKTAILNNTQSWYHYLKKNRESDTKNGVSSWNNLLKTGVHIKNPQQREMQFLGRKFQNSALSHIINPVKKNTLLNKKYELILYCTSGLKEGSLANVSWLQEFPDPVTKICWDNYLCVSPALAREHNLKEGQIVNLTTHKNIKTPVHIQPGQADGVLALALGYGQKHIGKVANNVGVDAWPMTKVASMGSQIFSALEATFKPTTKTTNLANTQGHHSMEGRQIVVETTLKKYLKNPGGAIHRHKTFSLWSAHQYPKHKWGMVINLNSCTGCSTCVIACQSENNIPTVGKDLVLQGREMHWIRIDRYYKGTQQNPEVVHQPVVCMHCDNAPCETVCPVIATVHSDEGTNDMIYNRCVGTRYCANNCPYKVRRFNWFNYEKTIKKPLDMALNPEVTVRSRGVMEKCSFCVHRIREAQATSKLKNRPLKDGDIQTACQQACPTGALTFGDLKDKTSKVYRLFHREDSYSLLEELNTKPAVHYQVKVRNKEEPKTQNKKNIHHE